MVGSPCVLGGRELITGSFVNRLIRLASKVDIHVLARRER